MQSIVASYKIYLDSSPVRTCIYIMVCSRAVWILQSGLFLFGRKRYFHGENNSLLYYSSLAYGNHRGRGV